MKHCLLLFVMGVVCQIADAQYGANGIYSSNSPSTVVLENTAIREVRGGTIIKPKFEGSGFTPTIRNAFNHACRIWEEKIPTTFPLNITVRMEHLLDNTALAVSNANYTTNYPWMECALQKRYWQVYTEEVDSEVFLNGIDAIITFNSDIPFDYNTDATKISAQKYDFITVAIQAIGKALGICLQAYYNGTNIVQLPNPNTYTRYVFNNDRFLNINTSLNYQNLVANGKTIQGESNNESWALYCPSIYNAKLSLNYFSVDSAENETLAMQPGISKGKAVRYIGRGIEAILYQCGWMDNGIVTGQGGNDNITGASTANVIPYIGNGLSNSPLSVRRNLNSSEVRDVSLYAWKEKQSPGNFVLKKDGSWMSYQSLYDLCDTVTCYARTIDGYLRLMNVSQSYGPNGSYVNYNIQHSLYHFPPQKPEQELISYTASNLSSTLNSRLSRGKRNNRETRSDDEFIDVKIGFENTEGCSEILVEQIDSDWPIPYTYYVDPSEGYFIAYMNKLYPSTIKLTYLNSDGQYVGDPQIFDFTDDVSTSEFILEIEERNSMLFLKIVNDSMSEKAIEGSFSISNALTGEICEKGKFEEGHATAIISSLSKGMYIVSVKTPEGEMSKKWYKK